MPTHKLCPDCIREKPTTEFYSDRSRHDGLNTTCKPCNLAKVKARQKAARRAAVIGMDQDLY